MSPFPRAQGELFRYSDSSSACVAFDYDLSHNRESGGAEFRGGTAAAEGKANTDASPTLTSAETKTKTAKLAVVAVGGLTDGFFALPYLPHLAELLRKNNTANETTVSWSLVTPLLSSSHRGWGTSSLDRDARELLELSRHLREHRGIEGVVLLGHSTGCQDAVRYAEQERERSAESASGDDDSGSGNKRATAAPPPSPPLLGIVLQAPVSDRECFFLSPETVPLARERLERARTCSAVAKEEEEEGEKDAAADAIVFFMREWDGAPVSARRWRSLVEKGGDDDYFSSDFSDQELSEKLWALAGRRKEKSGGAGAGEGKDEESAADDASSFFPTLILSSLREQHLPEDYDTAAHGRRLARVINCGVREGGREEGEEAPNSEKPAAALAVALDGDHALLGAEPEAARAIFDFISARCAVPPPCIE